MKEYPLIQLPGLDAIEAEKHEVLVNPDRVTYAIGGKTHAAGGTKMLAEPGSYILSDHLKLDPGVVKSLTDGKGKGKLSPAKIAKMYDTQKWSEILTSTDVRYDKLAKDTAALMFSKNAARQDMIYEAQEELKAKKGMKNDLENARSKRMFQNGGGVGNPLLNELPPPDLTEEQMFALNNPGVVNPLTQANNYAKNLTALRQPAFNVNTGRTLGFSDVSEDGYRQQHYFPFANDPYFDIAPETLKGGKLTPDQKRILGERQMNLSTLQQKFPGQTGVQIDKEYAKYLKAADQIEKDIYIDKFVVNADGSEIPLSDATEAQIDAAQSFRYFNKRTGKNDIVDYRDRQNQGFYPELTYTQRPERLDTSNLPITPGMVSMKPNLPDIKKKPVAEAPGEVKKGVDWQSIVNGSAIGLLAADLATTRTRVPYYDYAPSELAYTRFEPLSTRQQERAFNIAKEGLENSNLPQQVKSAQLANMYAAMQDGVSQVDIANYQGKLANDNRNVSLYNETRNNDIFRQQDSNQRYTQEAERRTAQASAQRQVYLDKIMDTWNKHVSNRRDVKILNGGFRNYDFSFDTEQVEYVPGQGNAPTPDRLTSFGQRPNIADIPSHYLTAEGRKALGY